jgi:hypothetical protein
VAAEYDDRAAGERLDGFFDLCIGRGALQDHLEGVAGSGDD